jgi:ribosome-associated heat shock protein Hsp15
LGGPGSTAGQEDRDWQRLDRWLWCARVGKSRAICAALIERGGFRLNRQPIDKAHAKLRPGDVLTFPLGSAERGRVLVWRVLALGDRRGPAPEARQLYEDLATDSDG